METIILYPDARRVEAVVLSIGKNSIRVVPRGGGDAFELRLNRGQWIDEHGVPIGFDAFFAADGVDISRLMEAPEDWAAAS